MPPLPGDNTRVELGGNYAIRAPGLRGNVERHSARDLADAGRTRSPAVEGGALDEAFQRQGMRDAATIELSDLRSTPAAAGIEVRSPSGDSALELQTPNPGDGFNTIVVAVDEAGSVRWNFPLTDTNAPETPVTRGPGDRLRFRIPSEPVPAPPAAAAQNRGLFGAIGRKFLKVLVYPVTDLVVGAAVDFFANNWEKKNRPYRIRTVTPENYTDPNVSPIEPNDSANWQRLSRGRALLFVHGTFSSTHSGFAGLAPENVRSLASNYNERVFAFDHFTLSHNPQQNVRELLERIPADVKLDVDIVCHSRGGLVARELVERQQALQLPDGRLRVGKVIFVGAANAGTVLTEPDHMIGMIDRFTSALNVLPDGVVTTILETIITAVKVVGHGGLKSLDGLAAMNPKGQYLAQLGSQSLGTASYVAVTADFEPNGTPFSKLALFDGVADRVFGKDENDLVVPTEGVFTSTGQGFPITNRLSLDASSGVMHTTYFRNDKVRELLLKELTGA